MLRCKNMLCKNNGVKNKCLLKVTEIDLHGKCTGFEKGFEYYFYHFIEILDNTNMIFMLKLDDDTRYCIYYLMKTMPISFRQDEVRGIICLVNTETDEIINSDDILKMMEAGKLNTEEYYKLRREFNEHGLPKVKSENKEQIKEENKQYGWLSPSGEFIESDFGTHEESAFKIIEKNHWEDEYMQWQREDKQELRLARDFLIYVKGYALIHDPGGLGRYIETHVKQLTKKQNEFLYDYFLAVGMRQTAESYLDED